MPTLSWVRRLFIERADLYIEMMEAAWSEGEQIAKAVVRILKEHGLETGKILDAFCGNGRVAIPLAREGYEVVGIDISHPFIKDAEIKAERNRVSDLTRFYAIDVRDVEKELSGEEFDAVLIVSTSLGYYDGATDEEILRMLRKVVRDGSLLIIANTLHRETPDWYFCRRTFHRFNNLVLMEDRRFDPVWSKLYSTWIILRDQGGKEMVKELEIATEMRMYSATELAEMLKRTGWGVDVVYGDIRKMEKFNPPCTYLSIVAKAI